jgi:hypothetical protein
MSEIFNEEIVRHSPYSLKKHHSISRLSAKCDREKTNKMQSSTKNEKKKPVQDLVAGNISLNETSKIVKTETRTPLFDSNRPNDSLFVSLKPNGKNCHEMKKNKKLRCAFPKGILMFSGYRNARKMESQDSSFPRCFHSNSHLISKTADAVQSSRYLPTTSSLTFVHLFTMKNARLLMSNCQIYWKYPSACEEFSKFIDEFLYTLLKELDNLKEIKNVLKKISAADVKYILKNRFDFEYDEQIQNDPKKKCLIINEAFSKILKNVFSLRTWKISKEAMEILKITTEFVVISSLSEISKESETGEITSVDVANCCHKMLQKRSFLLSKQLMADDQPSVKTFD